MSFAKNVKGFNKRTKDFLLARERSREVHNSQLRFKAETEQFLRELPKKNLELTQSNHELTRTMLEEIQAYFWSDPDIHTQVEGMLKEEDEYHEQELEKCKKRLGWKTTSNDAPSENIRWTD